jgi:hypothetical protein
MDKTESLLNERQKTHGDFDHFAAICQSLKDLCNETRSKRSNRQNEAVEMICNKLARVVTGDPNFEDHWDDIAGYAQLGKQGHSPELKLEPIYEPAKVKPRLKNFRVKYYYLASGMDGVADEKDYGIVYATTAQVAKELIAQKHSKNAAEHKWMLGCLSAKAV